MSMTNEQINLRLAEIYCSWNRIYDLADAVMYNPFINTEFKEHFFKLVRIKLFAISELVSGN